MTKEKLHEDFVFNVPEHDIFRGRPYSRNDFDYKKKHDKSFEKFDKYEDYIKYWKCEGIEPLPDLFGGVNGSSLLKDMMSPMNGGWGYYPIKGYNR